MYIKELSVSYRKKRLSKEASACLGTKVCSSSELYRLFKDLWKECVEKFYVLHLNNKNVIQSFPLVSVGHLTSSLVHPREVFKAALVADSASIICICIHNHPSGDPYPSSEDVEVTQSLKNVGGIIGVKLLDHLIIGNDEYFSLSDNSYL